MILQDTPIRIQNTKKEETQPQDNFFLNLIQH